MKTLVYVTVPLMFLFLGLALFTQLGWNLLGLAVFREYEVPAQSSIFTFKPIQWFKDGSGDWWTYGEDGGSYYYWEDTEKGGYKTITKDDAKTIQGFSPTNHLTWKK